MLRGVAPRGLPAVRPPVRGQIKFAIQAPHDPTTSRRAHAGLGPGLTQPVLSMACLEVHPGCFAGPTCSRSGQAMHPAGVGRHEATTPFDEQSDDWLFFDGEMAS